MIEWQSPGRERPKMGEVTFTADVAQIKTMADGSYRVTLDIGEQDRQAISDLLPSVKRVAFQIAMVPIED